MAAQVLKKRRLVNPGRRRKMTAKQIKYFGTTRQKAALKNRRRNVGPYSIRKTAKRLKASGNKYKKYHLHRLREVARVRKSGRRSNQGIVSQAEHAAERAIHSVEQAAEDAIHAVTRQVNRRPNVGEILTVVPANPGRRRRTMATKTANRRRASNIGQRRHNKGRVNPRVVVRYHNRKRNRGHHRQRNQGRVLSGNVGAVVGVLGGAAVTKIITGFLPSTLTSGWMGYLTTAGVAVGTGQMVGRMMKDRRLGNMVTLGGLLIVGLQLAGQFIPGLQLPFGLTSGTSGMGLLTSSNFYVPQVNMPGSMASFVTPAGIPAPVVLPASGMKGLGAMNQGLRRVGRLR